jgi:ribosomal protein S28E/S33
LYDVAGRRIVRLVDGPVTAGLHEVTWRGRDEAGRPVASGVYLAVLETAREKKTHKMVLLR